MSIKLKGVGEFLMNFDVAGTQAAASTTTVATKLIPVNGIIKAIYAKLGTAGVTGTQTTDIKKNGTTLAASGTVLSFATASVDPTYAALSVDPTLVAVGDVLSVVTTGVHSGTAAKDLNLIVVIQRLRGTAPVGATVTGGIGNDEVPA